MTTKQKKLTITVDGYEASQVEDFLDRKVAEAVTKRLEQKVADTLDERVSQLVAELTRERLSKDIEAVLAEGWTETDSYGQPTGKKYTVRDRINTYFNGRDRYSNESLVSRWIKESIDRDLKKAVQDETAKAKAQLRQMFDEALTGKFATTIREALGVK